MSPQVRIRVQEYAVAIGWAFFAFVVAIGYLLATGEQVTMGSLLSPLVFWLIIRVEINQARAVKRERYQSQRIRELEATLNESGSK